MPFPEPDLRLSPHPARHVGLASARKTPCYRTDPHVLHETVTAPLIVFWQMPDQLGDQVFPQELSESPLGLRGLSPNSAVLLTSAWELVPPR